MAKIKYEPEFHDELDRAWLLLKVNVTISPRLYNPSNLDDPKTKTKGFFVVRKDMVDGSEYKYVVPVYYLVDPNTNGLDNLIDELNIAENNYDVLKVKKDEQDPKPPHRAFGYIPINEHNPIGPGPQDWNTWG
jgi:hypothetical protein